MLGRTSFYFKYSFSPHPQNTELDLPLTNREDMGETCDILTHMFIEIYFESQREFKYDGHFTLILKIKIITRNRME